MPTHFSPLTPHAANSPALPVGTKVAVSSGGIGTGGLVIDRKQLEALAKKNAARQVTQKAVKRRQYDDTLQAEPENSEDPKRFFEEMKKREF
jgi:hypothetical protein